MTKTLRTWKLARLSGWSLLALALSLGCERTATKGRLPSDTTGSAGGSGGSGNAGTNAGGAAGDASDADGTTSGGTTSGGGTTSQETTNGGGTTSGDDTTGSDTTGGGGTTGGSDTTGSDTTGADTTGDGTTDGATTSDGSGGTGNVAPPVIDGFTLSSTTLPGGGGSITLSWTVSGADEISIDQGVGVVTGSATSVNVDATTTFTLTATNSAGNVTATRTVIVTARGTDDWVAQLGTTVADRANDVAADADGNVIIAGSTDGVIDNDSLGATDALVAKYSPDDDLLLWARQFGTDVNDVANAIFVDDFGDVYVTGYSNGDLDVSDTFTGEGQDLMLAKYSTDGDLLWARQRGGSEADHGQAVVVAADGSVFVAGDTEGLLGATPYGLSDIILAKYTDAGDFVGVWSLGTTYDERGLGVTLDPDGNVVMAGYTEGTLDTENLSPESGDAFVAKYTAAGALTWVRQLGTDTYDAATGVVTDSAGDIYIAGYTSGELNAEDRILTAGADAFVAKYSAAGDLVWTRQLGTAETESATNIAIDQNGYLYVAGYTTGPLEGSYDGTNDAFVAKYSGDGTLLIWARQRSATGQDTATGVATNPWGYVFIAGHTEGDFRGTNAGLTDAFVMRFD